MIPSLTSLFSTIAGKAAVGLVVASTSVGAAAAAGADVPFVSSSPAPEIAEEPVEEPAGDPAEETVDGLAAVAVEEPADAEDDGDDDGEGDESVESEALEVGEHPENHGAVVSGFVHETELEGCEKGQATAAVARGLLEPESETFEDELATYLDELGKCLDDEEVTETDDVDETAVEEEPNHGAVVSGFVHETELEGCEKGQATAAVARGDIEPGEDGTIDPVVVDEYLAGLDKCLDDDEETGGDELSVESADDDSDDDDDDDDDKGGKPDHAGQRGAERSQGKAKGPNK